MRSANPPDLGWLPRSRTLLQTAGALLAVALVLGFLGFSHKPTVPAPAKTDYTQKVAFAYDAAAKPSLVYPDGRVHDSAPIFTKLVQQVHFTAAYDFAAGPEHSIGGSIALDAVVSDSSPAGKARCRWHPNSRSPATTPRSVATSTLALSWP